jgi:hypothetical protein
MFTLFFAACGLAADPAPPSGDHTQQRAGYSNCVAWWAVPSWSCKECGGLIGGGCLRRGTDAGPYDGTWGWDYVGHGWRPNRIFLSWCPDCARQHKPGPYKVDGPNVPDVFAVKPIKRAVEKRQQIEE